jgi:hypothetical protein
MTIMSFLLFLPISSNAVTIDIDQIIWETSSSGDFDPSAYSGTVDMSSSGTSLIITLTNTSGYAGVDGSYNLLTGLGFNLPGGINVTGGDASMNGSTAINFTPNPAYGGSVGGEWGYANDPDKGHFGDGDALLHNPVNTVVSSMIADVDNSFNSNYYEPEYMDGPEFGLLRRGGQCSDPGGLAAIQDTVIFDLTLSGDLPDDWSDSINDEWVVISFASPDSTFPIPEPATMLLFGGGLIGLAAFGRKKFGKKL